MIAAILRISGRPATSTETLAIGGCLLLLFAVHTYGVLFHWDWMQKRWGKTMRWGRGYWSFPVSRLTSGFIGITFMLLGITCMADAMNWNLFGDPDYRAIIMVLWILLGIPGVALRDYYLHLNIKNDDDTSKDE
jgi:hypothetical protein